MTGKPNTSERELMIVAMLRAGTTNSKVKKELKFGDPLIKRIRIEYRIPLPRGRAKRSRTELDRRDVKVVTMLKEGRTHRAIYAELRLDPNTITRLRKQYQIPVPTDRAGGTPGRPPRTLSEVFEAYTTPTSDGHLIWTKSPKGSRHFAFMASKSMYNARYMAFERYHGRPPEGRLSGTPDCDVPDCIAGAHHADRRIRDGHGPGGKPR